MPEASRSRSVAPPSLRPWFLLAIALFAAVAARAQDGEWSLELAPVFTQVLGHDQHVLTVHELGLAAGPPTQSSSPVTLDTDDSFAYRGELQYARNDWTWGLDFFWFVTTQGAPRLTAAADGAGRVAFEVADHRFVSTNPDEVLYYQLLEDTDLEFWTVDLYALRSVAEGSDRRLQLQFGLRLGDFDNDYRAVVGLEGVAGVRLDASSNYDRLMGPLVGLVGNFDVGRNAFEVYLGQSVLLGTADKLTSMSREFDGPLVEAPEYTTVASFGTRDQDVAIPITEARFAWSYALTEWLALGAGVQGSVWWDVSVPPGVIPGEGGGQVFHDSTLVAVGLSASVRATF